MMPNSIARDSLPSPKLGRSAPTPRDTIYPYYAGFSSRFVEHVLKRFHEDGKKLILDPWNGAGTVTLSSRRFGLPSFGSDINPAMVVASKSKLVTLGRAKETIGQAVERIYASANIDSYSSNHDPLLRWFDRQTTAMLRGMAIAVDVPQLSSPTSVPKNLPASKALRSVIFVRALRELLAPFRTSNPTWIKAASTSAERLSLSAEDFGTEFSRMANAITSLLVEDPHLSNAKTSIQSALSSELPLDDNSVDCCITSPPYCTRIDYGIYTLPDLSVLLPSERSVRSLRNMLIGTTVVPDGEVEVNDQWGPTCCRVLSTVAKHPSKASNGYYRKTLTGYFKRLYDSIEQIGRVLKVHGIVVMVVQGSYYKDVFVDLPQIVCEMFDVMGVYEDDRASFSDSKGFAAIHNGRLQRLGKRITTEEVIWLRKR